MMFFGDAQCIRKVFRELHFFKMLLCYSLILKWIIFLKILQTIPHNDNMKEVFEIFENIFTFFLT